MRWMRAIDAMSGLTSQPCLGSIVEALRYGPRDPGLDPDASAHAFPLTGRRCARNTPPSRAISAPGASEVYLHEMPGGQFTNLAEQARALGIESALARGRAKPMPTSTRCSATSSR